MLVRIDDELLLMRRRRSLEERSSRSLRRGRDELSRGGHPSLLLSERRDGKIVDLSKLTRLKVLGVLERARRWESAQSSMKRDGIGGKRTNASDGLDLDAHRVDGSRSSKHVVRPDEPCRKRPRRG